MDWDALDDKFGGAKGAGPGGLDDLDKKYSQPVKSTMADLFAKAQAKSREAPSKEDWAKYGPSFEGNLRLGTGQHNVETNTPLPEFVNKGLAQFGSGVADLKQGFAQRTANAAEAPALEQETADKRQRDAMLNQGAAGTGLSIAGKVAPAMALPLVGGPIVGSALVGAGMGAMEPTAKGESATANAALSGGLGAVIPGGAAVVRALTRPAGQAADLAKLAAEKYGIPLGLSDLSSNGLVKGARSLLNDLPFVGAVSSAQNNTKQAAFNRAVGKTIGADAPSLTPEVVTQAKGKITGELNRVWNNNSLKLDGGLIQDYTRIGQRAADLNPEQQAMVVRQMQKLLQKADEAEIPGSFANNWQSELRLAVEGEKGLAKDVLNDLRQSTLKAFNRGVDPKDAEALALARRQYGNLKTLEPLLTKGELGVAGRTAGDVPAALLSNQVNQSMGARAVGTDLGNLSAIGSRYLVDRAAQTGGSSRALLQNGVIASGLTGAGFMGGGLVGAGAALPVAGAMNWAMGSPTVARALLGPSGLAGRAIGLSPAVVGPNLLGLTPQAIPGLLQ